MKLRIGVFVVLFFALSSAYVASKAAAATAGTWTQTTQADFQSDTLTNLDASSPTGHVQLPSPPVLSYGFDPINRSYGNDTGTNTFITSAQAPVSGAIVKYSFYSNAGCRDGYLCICCPDYSFQLYAFRDNGTMYLLVGRSAVITAVLGYNEISLSSPIVVQKGDLLGFYVGSLVLIPYTASNSLSVVQSGQVTTNTTKSSWPCAHYSGGFFNFCTPVTWSVQADIMPYQTGSLVSIVKDTGGLTTWGKLNFSASAPLGTSLSFSTRSSNDTISWSQWSANYTASGNSITSPTGRYVQYQAVLANRYNSTMSPSLHTVTLTYATTPPAAPAAPSPLVTYGPWLILVAVIVGFAVAVFMTKPKMPKTG